MLCSSGDRKWVTIVPMLVGGVVGDAPMLVHLFDPSEGTHSHQEIIGLVSQARVKGYVEGVSDDPVPPMALPESSPTARQLEVLRLISLGWDTSQIADD